MTSSMRNSLHRRNHKERSQLATRSKLGLLEKHKDYVKRARDYHSKQDRLQRLRQKAADKNKDEFYFAMTKQKTTNGVHHHDRGNVPLPMDMVKVLKTQDENYIRTVRSAGLKKIERIKTQLTMLANLMKSNDSDDEGLDDAEVDTLQKAGVLQGSSKRKRSGGKSKRVLFVDSAEEASSYTPLPSSSAPPLPSPSFTSAPVDLGWKTPKDIKRKQKALPQSPPTETPTLDDTPALDPTPSTRTHLLKELSARLTRDTQLRYAMRELEMQRLMAGKGARRKIVAVVSENAMEEEEDEDAVDARKGKRTTVRRMTDVDEKNYKPRVYKWKMERK
ncbi:small-subunit processome [Pterulicium gracile]|uniref:Small-subunit processome n=1 Tax=Pterulicium gracile TaxID=1884261 RepID=A0A5C3QMW8_9AGAR|nr:small-subunit processome [Pterula gracilis]